MKVEWQAQRGQGGCPCSRSQIGVSVPEVPPSLAPAAPWPQPHVLPSAITSLPPGLTATVPSPPTGHPDVLMPAAPVGVSLCLSRGRSVPPLAACPDHVSTCVFCLSLCVVALMRAEAKSDSLIVEF